MSDVLARVRVLLTAAPTYLVAAAAVVQVVVAELGDDWPAVAAGGTRVLAVLAAATAIVRRVTPVLPVERGLLPPGGTPGEAG